MESQSFCGLGDIVSIEGGVWNVCEVMVAEKGVFIRNEYQRDAPNSTVSTLGPPAPL